MPEAIRYLGALLPGGWPDIMAHNHNLALAARRLLADALSIPEPCPPAFIGSLAALPLRDAPAGFGPRLPFNEYPLQDVLREKYHIEVPIISWPAPPCRCLRVSAQLYNAMPQYEHLARALTAELPQL